jgi:hypothetical protein
MFRQTAVAACIAFTLPVSAMAEQDRVQTRDAFVSLVKDRALTRLGISLTVMPNGSITGKAFGKPVKGEWQWSGGYFCRDLFFGEQPLGPNCQVVEKRGDALRFIADKGEGDYADLRLR